MDADAIIADARRRLIAMADDPPYRFKATPRGVAEAYRRRLKTFAGYPEAEIARAEARLGVRFPAVYRAFLRELGRDSGDLFVGSYLAGVGDLDDYREEAAELMGEASPALALPAGAVVFLSHQGYSHAYFIAAGGLDAPVWQYGEGEAGPVVIAAGFAEFLAAELGLMEANDRKSRELGGYYLTVYEGGGTAREYPSLNSGSRPRDDPG